MPNASVGDELARRLQAGESLADLYAPDAVVHRNTPPYEQPAREHVALTRASVSKVIPDIHEVVEEVRVAPHFVLFRKAEVGTLPDGEAFYSPATVVYTLEAGRIARVDGWVDIPSVMRLAELLRGTPYGDDAYRS